MPDAEHVRWLRSALPPPPARLLEVGAGDGALAAALRDAGYDVLAIDPAPRGPGVLPVALHELRAPAGSVDAALAVLSLHHVEPLEASCEALARAVRPGGRLVVDEFDVERFDERAARWWIDRRRPAEGHVPDDPSALVRDLRAHLHPVRRVRAALSPWFALAEPALGPYLHRWELPAGLREVEEGLIAAGRLPATGVQFVGVRR
jgi:SAM-dependent methyltransferase